MVFQTKKKLPRLRKEAPPSAREIAARLKKLPHWRIRGIGGIPTLEKIYSFDNFREALEFAVDLGEKAEKKDHHPALLIEWGRAAVRWHTHKIKNLAGKDFIMAAETDETYRARRRAEKRETDDSKPIIRR